MNQLSTQGAFKQAYNPKTSESNALAAYLYMLTFMPSDLVGYGPQQAFAILLGLPITLPAALISSPVFFITRQASKGVHKLFEIAQKRKIIKIQAQVQQKYENEISQETWQKAVLQASQNLLYKNNKRMVVLSELKDKEYSQKNKREVKKQQNKQETGIKGSINQQKQYIFVINEDRPLMQILSLLSKQLKNNKQSFHLFYNNKIISINQRVNNIKADNLGIIRLSYAKVQSFG